MKQEAKRRSREEWAELAAEHVESGLSRSAFAVKRGLKEKTFSWWISELRRSGSRASARPSHTKAKPKAELVRALPVTLIDEQSESVGESMEVTYGDLRLQFPAGTDAVYVGEIFLELRSVC